ncbi:hypothetical protein H4582DRAFT_2064120 [Lactarius indigo]|nr:hypothetical protein H4582DRAFT_2064120 [Lactarius indigo]
MRPQGVCGPSCSATRGPWGSGVGSPSCIPLRANGAAREGDATGGGCLPLLSFSRRPAGPRQLALKRILSARTGRRDDGGGGGVPSCTPFARTRRRGREGEGSGATCPRAPRFCANGAAQSWGEARWEATGWGGHGGSGGDRGGREGEVAKGGGRGGGGGLCAPLFARMGRHGYGGRERPGGNRKRWRQHGEARTWREGKGGGGSIPRAPLRPLSLRKGAAINAGDGGREGGRLTFVRPLSARERGVRAMQGKGRGGDAERRRGGRERHPAGAFTAPARFRAP